MLGLKQLQKFWEYGAGRMVLAAFCAHSVSISIGICQGYSAILIPQLNSTREIQITSEEASWLASLGAISNPVGSILSGILAEYFGRKMAIQITTLPFLVGWLCIGFASDIGWLYTGRLITGIAAGMSSACYTYVSEISTPENRGLLQSLGPICASFGILLTYTLGYFLKWSTVSLISVFFALFTYLAVQFLPESPAYLHKTGNTAQSFDSYLWFRRSNAMAQEEVQKHTKHEKHSPDEEASSQIFFNPETLKPFFILVVLFLLQELSGIYTILFYAVNFFEETGLTMDNYVSSIIVGAIRFGASIFTAVLINKFGRKILCISSSAGMAMTMAVMGIYFKYYEVYTDETRIMHMFPLACVIFNVLFSMVGMLPIPWILVGELFPLQVRSIMCGVVICIAQCFIFICVKIYPDMIHYLGFSGTIATFFAASVASLIFCKTVLPETKNKSLQEIESYFRKERSGSLKGFDNRGFVLQPETLNAKNEEIFTVHIK